MDTVIGLGGAGCRIAEKFKKFPQYSVYKIDAGINGENCFSMRREQFPDSYEKNCPDMSHFFKDVSGDILFIIGGGGKISGATLQILKQLKFHNINLLYVVPGIRSLPKMALLQHRAVFSILQEYTRSAVFKKMFIVDNEEIEKIVGEVSIIDYNDKINDAIVNAIHYMNIFQHTTPFLENVEPTKETQRLATIGIYDIKNNVENVFFSMKNIGHKHIYYAINEDSLKTDNKLFKTIKDKAAEDRSSYEIHTTKYLENYAYLVLHSSHIQEVELT